MRRFNVLLSPQRVLTVVLCFAVLGFLGCGESGGGGAQDIASNPDGGAETSTVGQT